MSKKDRTVSQPEALAAYRYMAGYKWKRKDKLAIGRLIRMHEISQLLEFKGEYERFLKKRAKKKG